ncbi:hypothetical protein FALBO_6331 [Fusarium albosuccineum]|uniref:F-box domain-containing protein n=1 Tax=Fusarium albosuccineum TaxID=1237068 RepID=A0A8H4LEE8_9HYPO|nr:hypothetical protein FALBO_6331 [Fusarium albosuccineum]
MDPWPGTKSPLQTLPVELLIEIAKLAGPRSTCALGVTCKSINKAAPDFLLFSRISAYVPNIEDLRAFRQVVDSLDDISDQLLRRCLLIVARQVPKKIFLRGGRSEDGGCVSSKPGVDPRRLARNDFLRFVRRKQRDKWADQEKKVFDFITTQCKTIEGLRNLPTNAASAGLVTYLEAEQIFPGWSRWDVLYFDLGFDELHRQCRRSSFLQCFLRVMESTNPFLNQENLFEFVLSVERLFREMNCSRWPLPDVQMHINNHQRRVGVKRRLQVVEQEAKCVDGVVAATLFSDYMSWVKILIPEALSANVWIDKNRMLTSYIKMALRNLRRQGPPLQPPSRVREGKHRKALEVIERWEQGYDLFAHRQRVIAS